MAIKIGNLDISAFKVGSGDCTVYLGDTLLYPTTPPTFQEKWKVTYAGGTTSSAECDSTSAITSGEMGSSVVSVEIGDCVTSIDDNTFYQCNILTSVTIPDSVTSIGRAAFYYCNNLTSIDLPSGITNIGDWAFGDCQRLTSIEIPSGVTSIGQRAFQYCSGLTSVTIQATTPPTLANANAFANTNNCPIYVPSASVNAYKSATNWSNYASRIQAIP